MRLSPDLQAKADALCGHAPAKRRRKSARLTEPQPQPIDLALLVRSCEAAGFHDPVPEYPFHPVRKWRFDFAYPEYRVAFEREGGTWAKVKCECGRVRTVFRSRHHDRLGMERDAEKYNHAAATGWAVIRATPRMLKNGTALAMLLAALETRSNKRAA